MSEIKDSGERRKFETGAVRDMAEGKGRCDLMPLEEVSNLLNMYGIDDGRILRRIDRFIETKEVKELSEALTLFIDKEFDGDVIGCLLNLSVHYEGGAKKYSERNWERGIPLHSFIDSAIRHFLKYKKGLEDEDHRIAFVWNIIGAIYTQRVYGSKMDDIEPVKVD